ncbi:MAG TPA: tRNA (adenosine(37)-N6)-threonylcarbamoyltransferase complex dimerization subunit type 1 TsaB [Abditibacteriaceae bacterium]|jgi:tRNA threonylcarbamoyladenosine biosynthesis protein TsaB
MNILSVETSGAQVGIAALQIEGNTPPVPLAVLGSREPRQLSRSIIGGIASTLQRANWTLDDVQAIAVGIGPGSWTSLRIALSTCKTLAQVRGWQLAGVPTFDAMAHVACREAPGQHAEQMDVAQSSANGSMPHLPEEFALLVTGRCRAGEVYGKIFGCRRLTFDAPFEATAAQVLQPEWADAPDAVAELFSGVAHERGRAGSLVLIGDGSDDVGAALHRHNRSHVMLNASIEALAVAVGRLGAAQIACGLSANPLELQPLYVMPSAAERNLGR